VTTVLPLTVRVVAATVTPEAVVVATEWVTRGPGAAEVPVVPATVPAADAAPVAATPAAVAWRAYWARATAAVPVPAMSAAAVQLDMRRACLMLSRRGTPRLDGSMFMSFHASACNPRVRERQ
jgi:hypothetical protein